MSGSRLGRVDIGIAEVRRSSSTPAAKGVDGLAQVAAALGQGIGAGVVAQWQPIEDAGGFKFAQTRGQDVRRHAEVALQIAIPLGLLQQAFHDQQGPTRADNLKGGGEIAHAPGSVSGFIQNGE